MRRLLQRRGEASAHADFHAPVAWFGHFVGGGHQRLALAAADAPWAPRALSLFTAVIALVGAAVGLGRRGAPGFAAFAVGAPALVRAEDAPAAAPSGQSYVAFCQRRLFVPAGMGAATFTGERAPAGVPVATGVEGPVSRPARRPAWPPAARRANWQWR